MRLLFVLYEYLDIFGDACQHLDLRTVVNYTTVSEKRYCLCCCKDDEHFYHKITFSSPGHEALKPLDYFPDDGGFLQSDNSVIHFVSRLTLVVMVTKMNCNRKFAISQLL